MKIAMIGHKRIPSREGGVEIVVEELASRLVLMGHSVSTYNRFGKNVADENADKEAQKLREYKGIKLIRVPTPNNKKLNAVVYSFFATLHAMTHNYDVIHYHAEGPCAMLALPHFLGIRTIATIHGLDWQRAKWGGFATKYLLFGEKMAAKYADEVIVLSENGCLFDPDLAIRDGAMWGYFGTWGGEFVSTSKELYLYSEQYTEEAMLKKVYEHEHVITRDELPDLKNYPLRE